MRRPWGRKQEKLREDGEIEGWMELKGGNERWIDRWKDGWIEGKERYPSSFTNRVLSVNVWL